MTHARGRSGYEDNPDLLESQARRSHMGSRLLQAKDLGLRKTRTLVRSLQDVESGDRETHRLAGGGDPLQADDSGYRGLRARLSR